jgi:Flp pilus assembly protein TadB
MLSTIGGAAQDGAYARGPRDLAFPGSFENEEASMAYWPKTVRGNVLAVLLIVAAAPAVLMIAVLLSGPWVWAALVAVALASIALHVWRRRVEAARERAWVGAFSFGDVVASLRERDALDLSGR